MKWRGIRRDSLDVSTDSAQALLAIDNRYVVDGENRLRRGMARSSVEKKADSVKGIGAFSAAQGVVSATLVDGDRWQGYAQPYALWSDNPTYQDGSNVYRLDMGGLYGANTPSISCDGVDLPFTDIGGGFYTNSTPTTAVGEWSFARVGLPTATENIELLAFVPFQYTTDGSSWFIVDAGDTSPILTVGYGHTLHTRLV